MIIAFLFLLLYMPLINDSTESIKAEKSWYEDRLNSGIEAFYQTDWDRANRNFEQIKTRHPDDPTPYFFESMMPFLEYFFVDQSEQLASEFLKKSEIAVELSQQKLEETSTDTTMVLMLSGLYGYRGLVAAGQGEHRIALQSGLKGFNYTRQLLSIDSNRPDARIGKGMFYYMVGSVPSGMKWATNIFGLNAEIEDGFHELKIAAESDSYVSNDAKMMLMYLYQKEGRLEDALHYAEKLTKDLPDNVIFLYKKADILENLGNREAALNVYKAIINKNNPDLALITEKSRKKAAELEKTDINSR
ncbi:tetratricopeptide repeat protein [Rhodohalobacter sulfatireducens]|uniref:Tetratricopeptide repeat protein n=1 Tax=Rhodohalobacter sulfatireducens TaxID=2911366 RepID=A0ABS9KB33_9BACT|nr:tetratricopeptide repeat protein [Rhodohalobacter sulfatireducens]MCG2588046.1 tetratricopeptide repeat protein [Rhodohalobacter sulfatireducens]